MPTILVVDDEESIRRVIKEYARFEGFVTEEAEDGMQAIDMCRDNNYDLIIMDVMMPRLDGFSAMKEISKIKTIPVIMLSARSEEYDKLHGFDVGADDYVTKPFSPKELMARVNAVLKRIAKPAPNTISENPDVLKFEGLEIDMLGREVYIHGHRLQMTPKEYDLLFYLASNKGIALSRDKLLEEVWGYDFYGDYRTVDTHIKMLRNSLGEYRKFVVTLRGLGYKFDSVNYEF
jgi:DNA-binding response OmpR family regulator